MSNVVETRSAGGQKDLVIAGATLLALGGATAIGGGVGALVLDGKVTDTQFTALERQGFKSSGESALFAFTAGACVTAAGAIMLGMGLAE